MKTVAQASTQWHLPEGAKMRLGKGDISGNIAYAPDGTRLAVISRIGIWVYDTTTHQETALLTGHEYWSPNSVAFSPDGQTIAAGDWDKTIRIWDAISGVRKHTLIGHEDAVTTVAFSPDGKTLASASDDKTIRIWDAASGTHIHTIKRRWKQHRKSVTSVAFSPDGQTIASASHDGTVLLWRMPQPKL